MRWGFVGYGRIAQKFEQSLLASQTDKIVAVASRSKYNEIPSDYTAYSSYQDLYADPEVEILYVCTTHNQHAQNAIDGLRAGKHVLCEKPMGIGADEVRRMTTVAKEENRFLMEAIWSRYLPGYQKAMEIVRSGMIGEVQMLQANFGFRMNPDEPKERLLDPSLAAGAIWDVGIYPISLALDIFGQMPEEIQILGNLSDTRVETRAIIQLAWSSGAMSQLSCAFDLQTANHAYIMGTKGLLRMDDFWMCEDIHIDIQGKETSYHLPFTSTGYYHEIQACNALVSDGKIESDRISWSDSTQIAELMDYLISTVRKQ